MINRLSENFTVISNEVLSNPKISLKAKGLYSFLCSKPNNWKFSYLGLSSQLLESEKQLRPLIRELVENKLLIRYAIKDGNSFNGYEWIINPTNDDIIKYKDPIMFYDEGQSSLGLTFLGNPKLGTPEIGQPQKGKGISNNKEVKLIEVNSDISNKNSNDKSLLKSEAMQQFEIFRNAFTGQKNGFDTEFANFIKQNKNYTEILPLLLPAIEIENQYRKEALELGVWFPVSKSLKTWINQKCWEQELQKPVPNSKFKPQPKQKELFEFEKKAKEEMDNYEF